MNKLSFVFNFSGKIGFSSMVSCNLLSKNPIFGQTAHWRDIYSISARTPSPIGFCLSASLSFFELDL